MHIFVYKTESLGKLVIDTFMIFCHQDISSLQVSICHLFDSHRNYFLATSMFRLPQKIQDSHQQLAYHQQIEESEIQVKLKNVVTSVSLVKLKLDIVIRCGCFNKLFSSSYVFINSPVSFLL